MKKERGVALLLVLMSMALLVVFVPVIAATPSTTALSSSAVTAPVGQSITLTATVRPAVLAL